MIDLSDVECMTTTMRGEKAFTTKHLSLILGVGVPTVQKWLRNKKIKSHRMSGSEYFVTESQLRSYYESKGF